MSPIKTLSRDGHLNVNQPYRVTNRGVAQPIHLVVDCVVNDWLRNLMQGAVAEGERAYMRLAKLVA